MLGQNRERLWLQLLTWPWVLRSSTIVLQRAGIDPLDVLGGVI